MISKWPLLYKVLAIQNCSKTLLYGYTALSPASKEREELSFHLLLGLLQEATLGLQQAGWLGEGKEIEKMLYYATPTGSEGSSGTGSKEEPTNLGISLAQTGE